VWDSLRTAEVRPPWLRFAIVAMLVWVRLHLLAVDFGGAPSSSASTTRQ